MNIETITKAYADYIEYQSKKNAPQPHPYLYASSRRKCLRRSYYECVMPEIMPQWPTDVKARFLRGEQRETDIGIALTRAGQFSEPKFTFQNSQEPVKIYDRKGRLIISGKIDGSLHFGNEILKAEIKSWNSNLVDRIDTFEDVYNNQWTWSGAHQLLSYLYATNTPQGILILDRSGLPKFITVNLEENLEHMESFLKDAETVVDHIEAKYEPEFCEDITECKRCFAYGAVCNPPIKSGEGVQIFTDPEVEQKLTRYLEIEDIGDEYNKLDKWAKTSFSGVENGLAGSVLIQGKYQKYTKYNIPEDVKKQIETLSAPYKSSDPKGSFRLSFTKV